MYIGELILKTKLVIVVRPISGFMGGFVTFFSSHRHKNLAFFFSLKGTRFNSLVTLAEENPAQ